MGFETLFSKLSIIDDDNEKYFTEMRGKKVGAAKFDLACKEVCGKWGIWMDVGSAHLLIPPIDLFNSIFSDNKRLYVYSIGNEGFDKKMLFFIDVLKESYIYRWSLTSPAVEAYASRYYMQDAYVDGIKAVMAELAKKIEENAPLAYPSNDLKPGTVEMCIKQSKVPAVFPSFYMRKAADVLKETFVFTPHDSENYTIGIGERQYDSFLTHWDNSFEHIRHQLENYAYAREATLELSFDTSDTVLKLKHVSILDHTEKVGDGVAFKYQYYMRVEILSNEFADMPTLVGYCDIDETISTLYEGLLQMALLHGENGDPYGDEPSRLVAYNRYKSPILESILDPDYEQDYSSYRERQVHVKDVLTINPDYDYFLVHLDGTVEGYEDLDELCGKPVQIEGLEEWCHEMAPVVIEAAVGRTFPKDWESFHRKGIMLAKQLRKVLPKEYDLWYKAPTEDKSGTIPRPRLII